MSPAFIEANEVWAAEVDGTVLGFYALTGQPPQLTLDHMWVMPVGIGQGIGKVMFNHALARAAASGATSVEIEADPNAEGFYQRMGAVTVGEVSYQIDGLRRALPLMEAQVVHDGPAAGTLLGSPSILSSGQHVQVP
jgi:GNAT superfamily N-acetyltransferase